MKFTYNWLKELVDVDLAPAELASALTMAGLEVESLTEMRGLASQDTDSIFEVGVTPNRGDWLSIAGIAREVAALTGGGLKPPESEPPIEAPGETARIAIVIEDYVQCSRYSARAIHGVGVGPSPNWLQRRLEACGIRSINNVVDVTNYVMLEMGQPLHAFDLEKLRHGVIAIKPAGAERTFTTLDGIERELLADDLLIWDGSEPVALAGIMGGLDSEVRASTSSILLESANFAPISIRRTARRLGLHSEASHRFERGVDAEGTVAALNRAAHLLNQISPVRSGALLDAYPGKSKPPTIIVREERIEQLLGVKLDRRSVLDLLGRLGMKVKGKGRVLTVIPPSSRSDLTREADVIEELARVYGYNRIPSTLPTITSGGARLDAQLLWERKLRALLAGAGLHEVINLPFTAEALNAKFPGLADEFPQPVPVQNPLAKDEAEMRRSLIPGLIGNLRFNLAHKRSTFHAFHLGKVFGMANGQIAEKECIAGLLYGPGERHGLAAGKDFAVDFFHCKGVVESLLELFHLGEGISWEAVNTAWLHPGQSARALYHGTGLGYVGQVHPDIVQQLEVPAFFLFELDFTILLQYAPRRITVGALPRFPAIERDVALVVGRDFASEQVIRWIKELGEPLIEYVKVFDQYVGAPIPDGKKSLAYKISYRASERTLTDAEVNNLHQSLVERLGNSFGAEQRS